MATYSLTSTSTSATLNAFPICSSSDIPSISSPLSHRTANFFHRSSSSTAATTTTAPLSAVSVSSLSRRIVICQVALRSESESSAAVVAADEEAVSKVGSRVRVKVPLKVYHVPKVAEIDLTGKEGLITQYVGVWKGKRISANLPFKVEFHAEVLERGVVKFFAHLREDEFEYVG